MAFYKCNNINLWEHGTAEDPAIRNINTMDFSIPPGYRLEVFMAGLDCPIGMAFSDQGDLYIADSGINSGIAKIIRISRGKVEIIAQNFFVPISGISYFDGVIYVSHKGFITILRPDGTRQDIISGLLCNGDNTISNVAFGADGKLYFGIGTVTNSGVVGNDNPWVYYHPFLCDYPAADITVNGQNFETGNIFNTPNERTYTGAFAPYGVANIPLEIKRGYTNAPGSILRANRDGTGLEVVAWGLRNPVHVRFDREFRLFAANRGYDVRGSRPIANALDEFHLINQGVWYGWPDYSAGEPVTLPKFRPEGRMQPELLLAEHPNQPPIPYAVFPPHSSIIGFDFNYNQSFGYYGDVFIAEFGSYGRITMGETAAYVGVSQKVSRINMQTGEVSTFIANKSGLPAYISGEGGFGRPVDIKFGPEEAMYILDYGIYDRANPMRLNPDTGVLWRVVRENNDK